MGRRSQSDVVAVCERPHARAPQRRNASTGTAHCPVPCTLSPVERLYTPWRSAYVTSADAATGCFLCEKPREDADAANLIVYRDARVYAILNLYPYNTGHVMVTPYAHGNDLAALDGETSAALMALTQRVVGALREEYRPDAFNIGMNLGRPAGAGVPDHMHMHIVPRWSGDTNYMAVLGETKVLSETLDQTWGRVTGRLREQA